MPKKPPKWMTQGITEKVQRLKEITGIEVANCTTCCHGSPEYDGDHGEKYCGMLCNRLPDDPDGEYLYVEDFGVSSETEKGCWEPDFWFSNFSADLAGDEQKYKTALKRFTEAVKAVNQGDSK